MSEQITEREKETRLSIISERAKRLCFDIESVVADMEFLVRELSDLREEMRTVDDQQARIAELKKVAKEAFDECVRQDPDFLSSIELTKG